MNREENNEEIRKKWIIGLKRKKNKKLYLQIYLVPC